MAKYAIEVIDGSITVAHSMFFSDISKCADDVLIRLNRYVKWLHTGVHPIDQALTKYFSFDTYEDLELNLVLAGAFDAKPGFEIRPKRIKYLRDVFVVE